MAISIKHKFQSEKEDGDDDTVVRPSDWNAEHDLTLAQDKLLGRASSGTGDVEEITCTAAGRALLDDADAGEQRTTLGLGSIATQAAEDYYTAAEVDAGFQPRLPVGTAGYHLQMDTGGDPVWAGFALDTGTAVERTWASKVGERISPKDFGAVGDGTTDDAAAIQKAIAYAETLSNASDSDSVLDGVFTVIDCSGATWGIGSTGLQFTNTKNVIILGGRFKAVGTWASAGPIFNIVGASTIAVANLKFQDITIDCDKKANGIHVENAPRTLIVNPRITHQKEYGIEFHDNVWGSAVYEPVIHEWDSDDPELENASLREADGIRLSGLATDVRTISGFIGFNKRGVAILDQAGFGCHFVATHIYDSALVTPQENDLVYAEATTNSTQFISCYFDTGWVHLLGAGNHIFQNCRFYRNENIAPAGLTAYIHWEATDTNQGILTRLIGNYWQDHSFPIVNPIGKFTEDGGNSYAFNKGTFETAARDNWIIREPLSITISSFTPDVLALRSNHSNACLAFDDANTTTPPKIGSQGDDLEITVSGDVTINGVPISTVGADLTAIEALSGTGFPTRTAADTWAQRTITGTANEITVANGNGVSGNPTLSLPAALTFTGKTVTGGTLTGLSAVRVVNGTGTIQARNAEDNGDITIAGVDSNNFLRVGDGAGLFVFHAQPVPLADGTVDLGSASLKWKDIHATNGTIQTSDARLKDDIAPLPSGALDIIGAVEPITFRWKSKSDTRIHWGFRAGDIKAAVDKVTGLDCAAYVKDPATGEEGLRTHQLIPILWKAIQELSVRCAALEAKSAGSAVAS